MKEKQILIFGAGMVARPTIDYLAKENQIIVIDKSRENLNNILENINTIDKQNVSVKVYDIKEILDNPSKDGNKTLNKLIEDSNAVISLLPSTMHHLLADRCIEYQTPMVTASYESPEMKALENKAKQKGVLIVNECGLDPGLDHMSAMKIFDEAKQKGGNIISFESYCGGLPSNKENNPLAYQFSWSPEGVLKAAKASAKYLKEGSIKEIESGELFKHEFDVEVPEVGILEGYYNRDSLSYIETYSLENITTMIRGTLRYPGWCSTLQAINDVGLLEDDNLKLAGMSYEAMNKKLIDSDSDDTKNAIAEFLGLNLDNEVIKKFEWLGLFSQNKISSETNTPIKSLCDLMKEKMAYKEGQTDMVVMKHKFKIDYSTHTEIITSSLVYHGELNGYSAMAKTVGLPVAYATELLLDGKIKQKSGLCIPITSDFYNPILGRLQEEGIEFKEEVKRYSEGGENGE